MQAQTFINKSLPGKRRVYSDITLKLWEKSNSLCSVRSSRGKHSVIGISLMPTTPTKFKGQWSRTGVKPRQETSLSRRKMYGPSYVSNTCQSSISLMETVETEVVSRPPHSGAAIWFLKHYALKCLVQHWGERVCGWHRAPGQFSTDASPAGTASIYRLAYFLWRKQQKTKFPTRLRPSVHCRSPWQFWSFLPDIRRLSGGSALRRTPAERGAIKSVVLCDIFKSL